MTDKPKKIDKLKKLIENKKPLDELITGVRTPVLINPTPSEVQSLMRQVDQESQHSTGKLGMLRFVASRMGDVAFGDALHYWHKDLQKRMQHDDDCLLGFIRANGTFYLKSGTINWYTGIPNSTTKELRETHFFKTYGFMMKELKFAGDDEHTD